MLVAASLAQTAKRRLPRSLAGEEELKAVKETKESDDGVNNEDGKDADADDQDDEDDGPVLGCHNELLYSYGILNAGLVDDDSRLCMDAKRSSCCSATSEEIVMNYWKNNNKIKIKQYIESYLWVFKSILNYYELYVVKAKAINDFPSSPLVCKNAAKYLTDNYIVKTDIEIFMDKLSKMYDHVANIRKGFYCMLCSSNTQTFFDPYEMTVQFAKKFCENLVQTMIAEVHTRNEVYMNIFNAMSVITECDPNEGFKPEIYSIDMTMNVGDRNKVDKCHEIYVEKKQTDPRVFFDDCREFCSAYSLTKATEIFEGNFGKLNYLYIKLKSKKEFPEKEQLIFDYINPKSDDWDFEKVSDEFFDANLRFFDLERYTLTWDRKGIELFYLASQSRTNFGDSSLASAGLASGVLFAMVNFLMIVLLH